MPGLETKLEASSSKFPSLWFTWQVIPDIACCGMVLKMLVKGGKRDEATSILKKLTEKGMALTATAAADVLSAAEPSLLNTTDAVGISFTAVCTVHHLHVKASLEMRSRRVCMAQGLKNTCPADWKTVL